MDIPPKYGQHPIQDPEISIEHLVFQVKHLDISGFFSGNASGIKFSLFQLTTEHFSETTHKKNVRFASASVQKMFPKPSTANQYAESYDAIFEDVDGIDP